MEAQEAVPAVAVVVPGKLYSEGLMFLVVLPLVFARCTLQEQVLRLTGARGCYIMSSTVVDCGQLAF